MLVTNVGHNIYSGQNWPLTLVSNKFLSQEPFNRLFPVDLMIHIMTAITFIYKHLHQQKMSHIEGCIEAHIATF